MNQAPSLVKNIYIEINGIKIGAIKSYSVKSNSSSLNLETLWGSSPAECIKGNVNFTVNLTKLCLKSSAVDFYNLKNFTLKIVKPFETLTFYSCEWTSIEEYGNFNESILENLTVISLKIVKTT